MKAAAAGFALAALAAAAAHGAPRLLAPGVVATGESESHPTLGPDGRTLLFLKMTPDFAHWTVVESRRRGAGWSAPRVAWFSGRWDDADVSFSPDGRTIWFVSTRPDDAAGPARGDTDIFRMRRDGAGWGPPERVVELASPGFEWFPNQSADGTLWFGSERREGNLGPAGTSDLWRARWTGDRFAPPENLGPAINGAGQEIEPWISADGALLVFAAKGRPDGLGSYDLFAAWRCGDGAWSAPRPLGGGVNSSGWDFAGRFSPDGATFLFASDRRREPRPADALAGAAGYRALVARLRAPGNGLFDIYAVPAAELALTSPCAGLTPPRPGG